MKRIIVFLLSMTLISACARTPLKHPGLCSIEFTKPMNGQKFIMSPNNLSVAHIGKCWPIEGSFQAWIDKEADSQQRIESSFYYNRPFWHSKNADLPMGMHSFFARAKISDPYTVSIKDTGLISVYVLPSPDSKIKIMPLGDSITLGCCLDSPETGCEIGYRHRLYSSLTDAKFNIEFVGREQNPDPEKEGLCEYFQFPLNFDRFHEGHIGKTASWMVNNIDSFLDANPPHVILLHIGTNDLTRSSPANECLREEDEELHELVPCAVWNVKNILNKIDTWEIENNQDIIVFIALIIKGPQSDPTFTDYNRLVEDYNNNLEVMVTDRINNDNDKIILVDMESGTGLEDEDYGSGLHPNASGYEKIADLWFRHLVSFLPNPEL